VTGGPAADPPSSGGTRSDRSARLKHRATLLIRWAIARWSARYGHELPGRGARAVRSPEPLDAVLLTFCGHRDVPQAAAMVLSVLIHAGSPREVVVGSDGTLTADDTAALRLLCSPVPCSIVEPEVPEGVPHRALVESYAAHAPLGKKLALLVGHGGASAPPILYCDSDILCFGNGVDLRRMVATSDRSRFMADSTSDSYDTRFRFGDEPFVNSGFLFLPRSPDWSAALDRCADLLADPQHFTEQTVAHVAVHAGGGEPLSPDRYLLRHDDVWSLRDEARRPGVVARHYVSPIRWKLWSAAFGGPLRAAFALVRPRPRSG
jgi:hypothetical protein